MKVKKNIIIVCGIMLLAFVLGASGIIKVHGETAQTKQSHDRMVGVFITREPLDLFDDESFFTDNIDQLVNGKEIDESQMAKYQGRLYAKLVETEVADVSGEKFASEEYIFEGVDGIRCFAAEFKKPWGSHWGTNADDGISDLEWKFEHRDEGCDISVTGTIYTSSEAEGVFYYNPVYQTEDGEVYAVSGTGSSFGVTSGSLKLAEDYTETVNEEETISHSIVEIANQTMETPISVSIIQLDKSHSVLNTVSYEVDVLADSLPEQLDVLPETDYILVETKSEKGVSRNICQKTDESLYVFYPEEGGICMKKDCMIHWN